MDDGCYACALKHSFADLHTASVKFFMRRMKSSKQLSSLNLLTLHSETLQMEQNHVVFLPCLEWWPPEWSNRQHQTQLDCLRSEQARWAILWFICLAICSGIENWHLVDCRQLKPFLKRYSLSASDVFDNFTTVITSCPAHHVECIITLSVAGAAGVVVHNWRHKCNL